MSVGHDWVDYISAIGTAAAAVIALFIGVRQGFVDREMRKAEARLVASSLLPKLTHCVKQIDSALDEVLSWKMPDEWQDPTRRFRAMHSHIVSAQEFSPTLDELRALIPVPNNRAAHLAQCLSLLSLFEKSVLNRMNQIADPNVRQADRDYSAEARDWSSEIQSIQRNLALVLSDLEEFAFIRSSIL
ncbi:hypothetical protein [Robbsia andropogonis]|uniref:hypothetical protein n=1 Tax=Robbsia andropogonis TaxID=28092 RepID=UPI000465A8C7|nr:hypothetical protein [Robbsia andropogonis]